MKRSRRVPRGPVDEIEGRLVGWSASTQLQRHLRGSTTYKIRFPETFCHTEELVGCCAADYKVLCKVEAPNDIRCRDEWLVFRVDTSDDRLDEVRSESVAESAKQDRSRASKAESKAVSKCQTPANTKSLLGFGACLPSLVERRADEVCKDLWLDVTLLLHLVHVDSVSEALLKCCNI